MSSAARNDARAPVPVFPLTSRRRSETTIDMYRMHGEDILSVVGRKRDRADVSLSWMRMAKRVRLADPDRLPMWDAFGEAHDQGPDEEGEPGCAGVRAVEPALQIVLKSRVLRARRVQVKFGWWLLLASKTYEETLRVGAEDRVVRFFDLPLYEGYTADEGTEKTRVELNIRGVFRLWGSGGNEARIFASALEVEEGEHASGAKFESFVAFVDSLWTAWQDRGGWDGWHEVNAWSDLCYDALESQVQEEDWDLLGRRVEELIEWHQLPPDLKRAAFDRSELSRFPVGCVHQMMTVAEREDHASERVIQLLRRTCKRFWECLGGLHDGIPPRFLREVLAQTTRVTRAGLEHSMEAKLREEAGRLRDNAEAILEDDSVPVALQHLVSGTLDELEAQMSVYTHGVEDSLRGTNSLRFALACEREGTEATLGLGDDSVRWEDELLRGGEVHAVAMYEQHRVVPPISQLVMVDQCSEAAARRIVLLCVNVSSGVVSEVTFSDPQRAREYLDPPGKTEVCDPLFWDTTLRNALIRHQMATSPYIANTMGAVPRVFEHGTLHEFLEAESLETSRYMSGARAQVLEAQFDAMKAMLGTAPMRQLPSCTKLRPTIVTRVASASTAHNIDTMTGLVHGIMDPDLNECLCSVDPERVAMDLSATLLHRVVTGMHRCEVWNRRVERGVLSPRLRLSSGDLAIAYRRVCEDVELSTRLTVAWPVRARGAADRTQCTTTATAAMRTLAAERFYFAPSSPRLSTISIHQLVDEAKRDFLVLQAIGHVRMETEKAYWEDRRATLAARLEGPTMAELVAEVRAREIPMPRCHMCTWVGLRKTALEHHCRGRTLADGMSSSVERTIYGLLSADADLLCQMHREKALQDRIKTTPEEIGQLQRREWNASRVLAGVSTPACGVACECCEGIRLDGRVRVSFVPDGAMERAYMVVADSLAKAKRMEVATKSSILEYVRCALRLPPSAIVWDTKALRLATPHAAAHDELALTRALRAAQLSRELGGGVGMLCVRRAIDSRRRCTQSELRWDALVDPDTPNLAHVLQLAYVYNLRSAEDKGKRNANALRVGLMHEAHPSNLTMTPDRVPRRLLASDVVMRIGGANTNLCNHDGVRNSDLRNRAVVGSIDVHGKESVLLDHNTGTERWYYTSGRQHVISNVARGATILQECLPTHVQAWNAGFSAGALAAVSPDAHNVTNSAAQNRPFRHYAHEGRHFAVTTNQLELGRTMLKAETVALNKQRKLRGKRRGGITEQEYAAIKEASQRKCDRIQSRFPNCKAGPEPLPSEAVTVAVLQRLMRGCAYDDAEVAGWAVTRKRHKYRKQRTVRADGGWQVPRFTQSDFTLMRYVMHHAALSAQKKLCGSSSGL